MRERKIDIIESLLLSAPLGEADTRDRREGRKHSSLDILVQDSRLFNETLNTTYPAWVA
jgi:hypothetical protein